MADKHGETQEQSIKARKNELFDGPAPARIGSDRPFREFLRETPAGPLSPATKAILWVAALVVVAILAAALFKGAQGRSKPRPKAGRASIAAGVRAGAA